MNNEEAKLHLQSAKLMLLGADGQPVSDLYYAVEKGIKALEQGDVLQEIWNKTYGLHPINRGDDDYANGVYDGMCRVINIVCNTIDSKIKELSE